MSQNNEILFQKATLCLIVLGMAELWEIQSLINPPFLAKMAIFLLLLITKAPEAPAQKS